MVGSNRSEGTTRKIIKDDLKAKSITRRHLITDLIISFKNANIKKVAQHSQR